MAQADIADVAGVVQVFVAGKYEGFFSDFSFSRPRNVTATGVANGTNVQSVGIEKPTCSFTRPMLKTSTGQQVAVEVLDGPVNIDVQPVGSDQQWRLIGCRRSSYDFQHTPDSGNTTERFALSITKVLRIK